MAASAFLSTSMVFHARMQEISQESHEATPRHGVGMQESVYKASGGGEVFQRPDRASKENYVHGGLSY